MAKTTRSKRKTAAAKRPPAKVKKPAATATPTAPPPADEAPAPAAKRPKLPASWTIAIRALRLMWQYRLFFGWLLLIYGLLDILLVHSVSVFDVATLKASLSGSLQHGAGQVVGGLSVFSSLFSSAASGASTDATGAYHFFVVLLVSLVVIWGLRQIFTDRSRTLNISVRQAFYSAPTPVVPFLLIFLLLVVQLIPFLAGSALYSWVVVGGIAAGIIEQLIFLLILLGLAALSMFWISRTVVALYIVTLPDMRPLAAYKDAKQLVQGRRLSVIRKLLFLPLAMFVVAAVIVVPCILIWAPLAQWVFYVLALFGLLALNTYLYSLYRELLV